MEAVVQGLAKDGGFAVSMTRKEEVAHAAKEYYCKPEKDAEYLAALGEPVDLGDDTDMAHAVKGPGEPIVVIDQIVSDHYMDLAHPLADKAADWLFSDGFGAEGGAIAALKERLAVAKRLLRESFEEDVCGSGMKWQETVVAFLRGEP